MIQYKNIKNKYLSSQRLRKNNSILLDNSCDYDEVLDKSGNSTGLRLYRNELLTTYLPSIIQNSNTVPFETISDARKFYRRPKLLSEILYGVEDYWYLILAVNSFNSIHEFKDFKLIIAPDEDYVKNLITEMESNKK